MSNSFPKQMSWEWNREFTTRRDIDYAEENKPYVGTRARLGVEGNVEAHEEPGEEESIASAFMRGGYESEVCLPEADKVENFCFGADLDSFRTEAGQISECVALLYERSCKGSRTYEGPLTARKLKQALEKHVRCSDPVYWNPFPKGPRQLM